MPPASPARRVRELRLPATGVVAAALTLAAVAVLFVIGFWASRLGSPPSWAFDCDDTTCTDLWVDARHHYLWTAAGASLTALFAVLLGTLAVPRRAVPRRAEPRRTLRRLVAPFLLSAAVMWVASWLSLALSRPFGLAVALLAGLLAFLSAWRWLRPGSRSDRAAYLLAGLGTAVPLLIGGALALQPPLFFVLLVLFASPWLGVPLLTAVLICGAVLAGLLLPRTGDPALTPEPVTGIASPAADADTSHQPSSRLSTWVTVVVIVLFAALAAWPVPAPPADAWQLAGASDPGAEAPSGTASGQVPGAEHTADPGGDSAPTTGSAPGTSPAPETATAAAPDTAAADQPPCSPQSLQLVAEGWDSMTGDSAVTLRATNVGATSCMLTGTPELTLTQGGGAISLRPEPLTHLQPAAPAAGPIGIAPGDSALSRLYWPGYRNAADQETARTLTVQIDPTAEPVPVRFLPTPYGDDPGPAPFDLKAGVEGGAVIEIGPWETAPSSRG